MPRVSCSWLARLIARRYFQTSLAACRPSYLNTSSTSSPRFSILMSSRLCVIAPRQRLAALVTADVELVSRHLRRSLYHSAARAVANRACLLPLLGGGTDCCWNVTPHHPRCPFARGISQQNCSSPPHYRLLVAFHACICILYTLCSCSVVYSSC